MIIQEIYLGLKRMIGGEIRWLFKYMNVLKKYRQCKSNKHFFILAGTPLHGNLGDHAIALAEYQLLNEIDKNKTIFEIPSDVIKKHIWCLKKIIKNSTILIHGGGFMGSLWLEEELMMRNLLITFPENHIIILPQTIYFEDDERGRRIFREDQEIYANHHYLQICTREKKSYELAQLMIKKENVHLIPDMVPYLQLDGNKTKEKAGAVLCLRNDKEKILTKDKEAELLNLLKKYFDNQIDETDTVVPYFISPNEREKEVRQKIDEFSKYRLVITDRLHGMVFSAIAGTPCITISNCNYKVKGVYEWIQNNSYIRFVEDFDEIEGVIQDLLSYQNVKYDNECLNGYYEELKELIRNV